MVWKWLTSHYGNLRKSQMRSLENDVAKSKERLSKLPDPKIAEKKKKKEKKEKKKMKQMEQMERALAEMQRKSKKSKKKKKKNSDSGSESSSSTESDSESSEDVGTGEAKLLMTLTHPTTKGRGRQTPKKTPKRKAPSPKASGTEEEGEEEEDYGPRYVKREVPPAFPLYRATYDTRSLI
jgi:hypothetical protein